MDKHTAIHIHKAAQLATQYAVALASNDTGTAKGDGPRPKVTDAAVQNAVAEALAWEGVLAVEGELTGDGRLIEPGALTWDISPENPSPLRVVFSDSGAHDGAITIGRILTVERRPDGVIWGTGDFDTGSESGVEAARLVRENLQSGVSVDLDSVNFEIRVAMELLDGTTNSLFSPIVVVDDNDEGADDADSVKGNDDDSPKDDTDSPDAATENTPDDTQDETPGEDDQDDQDDQQDKPDEEFPTDDEGRAIIMQANADDEIMVTTSAQIRAATLVAVPAFKQARIQLATTDNATSDSADDVDNADNADADDDSTSNKTAGTKSDEVANDLADLVEETLAGPITPTHTTRATDHTPYGPTAILAAAAPLAPPTEWFENPNLTAPTPLVVTDDGRVYGHLATWNTCHIASPGGAGICVEPPHSPSGYAYFHTGATRTDNGSTLATGRLVLGTKHAPTSMGAYDATRHYDDTGRAAADVRVGEDQHGIWVAGALRPTLSDEDRRVLKASPLSGDWRSIGGQLELVGALAVNVPGFPIPRPTGLVASGELMALVASGMLPPKKVLRPGTPGALSSDDLRYLKRLADRERAIERQELAARIDAQRLAAARRKVKAFATRTSTTTRSTN